MKDELSLKIGVSGIRGIAGVTLTPQLVTSFAAAFGTNCGAGPILIGTDTRPSRDMLSQAAIAGLLSVGCSPVDLGIVPAPTLQMHTRRTEALGGICVSGSHNPQEWNALKFVAPDGVVLRASQFAQLLALYHQGVYPRVGADEIQEVSADDSAASKHREAVREAVDVEKIRQRRFKIVLDCCNGAASESAPRFLQELGCDVVSLHSDPDASFPRAPEPVPEELDDLCRRVTEVGADLGFALDADADRLALVDHRGQPLGEDCTVALVVRHVLMRKKPPGPVVVSMSTSRMVEDIAAEHGYEVERTKVGETNVVECMLKSGSRIGGEGNGGVVATDINPCRDGFVGMALMLEALAEEGGTLEALREQIPRYTIVKEKLPSRPRDVAPALRVLRRLYGDQELDLTDGLRVVWPDRWLHVRGSNTESVLRISAEARDSDTARDLVRSVMEYLRPSGG